MLSFLQRSDLMIEHDCCHHLCMPQEPDMKRVIDRILTRHTGGLPRPPELLEMILAVEMSRLKIADSACRERKTLWPPRLAALKPTIVPTSA
jgi:hypothetical protein